MQFSDVDCYRILRALQYYQRDAVSHEVIWDQCEDLIKKVKLYQENYSVEE